MTRSITRLGLSIGFALLALPLAACVENGYGYDVRTAGYNNSYNGWYDGYYGPLHDGYWGTDDYFYYRRNDRDHYRRGDRHHFYRGDRAPDGRYQRFDTQTRQTPRGTRMPNYPRQSHHRARGQRGGQHNDRGHHHRDHDGL